MLIRSVLVCASLGALLSPAAAIESPPASSRTALDAMVVKHARANNVPYELVHRVIMRESRYNPRAVSRGNYGLMQIRHGTARGLGYAGSPQGLLDPETNLTYAVRYLAGAYRVANGNHDRAVAFYARGYYYEAKRRGMRNVPVTAALPQPEPAAPEPVRPFFGLFSAPVAAPAPAPVVVAEAAPEEVAPPARQPRVVARAPLPPPRP